jgi:hypothetical protein
VEIAAKDAFWRRAFDVEWEHQFPDRKLTASDAGQTLANAEWLKDLERVAAETFCRVTLAPENRNRRDWLGSIVGRRGK